MNDSFADAVGVGGGIIGVLIFLAIGLFFLVLAVLWFLLPFAVFGIKDRLDMIIRETRNVRDRLEVLPSVLKPVLRSAGATGANEEVEDGK